MSVVSDALRLESVRWLSCGDAGFVPFVVDGAPRWAALSSLRMQHAGLTSLPDGFLASFRSLAELRLDRNHLRALPPLHAVAPSLRVLTADHNSVATLPAGLAACTKLCVLSLEHNALSRPIVDLRCLASSLKELRLGGNPLEYVPELGHCVGLTSLSLANARITSAGAGTMRVTALGGAFDDDAHTGGGGSEEEEAGGGDGVVPHHHAPRARSVDEMRPPVAPPHRHRGAYGAGGGASGVVAAAATSALLLSCSPPVSHAPASPQPHASPLLPPLPLQPAPKRDLAAFYALIFRFSSCQLPLLAAALASLAAEPEQAEAMAGIEGALPQLLSMSLSGSPPVVASACACLRSIASASPAAASRLVAAKAPARLLPLLGVNARGAPPPQPRAAAAALLVFAAVAWASPACGEAVAATPGLLRRALDLCSEAPLSHDAPPAPAASPHTRVGAATNVHDDGGDDDDGDAMEAVRVSALVAVGNMALSPGAAAALRREPGARAALARAASGATVRRSGAEGGDAAGCPVQRAASRALRALGDNAALCSALGRPPCRVPSRGLRILAMDGGGMRGLATLRQLEDIENRTGRSIWELFDLICGTSTGGSACGRHCVDIPSFVLFVCLFSAFFSCPNACSVLAAALGVHRHSTDCCEALYRHLGAQVFSPDGAATVASSSATAAAAAAGGAAAASAAAAASSSAAAAATAAAAASASVAAASSGLTTASSGGWGDAAGSVGASAASAAEDAAAAAAAAAASIVSGWQARLAGIAGSASVRADHHDLGLLTASCDRFSLECALSGARARGRLRLQARRRRVRARGARRLALHAAHRPRSGI